MKQRNPGTSVLDEARAFDLGEVHIRHRGPQASQLGKVGIRDVVRSILAERQQSCRNPTSRPIAQQLTMTTNAVSSWPVHRAPISPERD